MCGRGALEQKLRDQLEELYGGRKQQLLDDGVDSEWAGLAAAVGAADVAMEGPRARYNIAPTDWIPTLVDAGELTLMDTKWGVSRGPKRSPAFNARLDQVLEGSFWAATAVEGRAIHVLSGFYEWRGGQREDPVYVTRKDGAPLLLAALAEERPNGTTSATITQESPAWFESVHNRLPIPLEQRYAEAWLAGSCTAESLPERTLGEEAFEVRPVQTMVNKVQNDGPHLVLQRPTLF